MLAAHYLKRSKQSVLISVAPTCLIRKPLGLFVAVLVCWFGAVVGMLKDVLLHVAGKVSLGSLS